MKRRKPSEAEFGWKSKDGRSWHEWQAEHRAGIMRLPTLPPAWWERKARKAKPANPKGGRKAKAKGRPSIKFDLVLKILADIKPAPGLQPAEIEKKVLPEFKRRWAKLKPDDKAELPVSRRTIFRAYQKHLKARSSK